MLGVFYPNLHVIHTGLIPVKAWGWGYNDSMIIRWCWEDGDDGGMNLMKADLNHGLND